MHPQLLTWLQLGNVLPTCVNLGCSKSVAIRHWSDTGIPSLKSECTRCATARKKNKSVEGVTILKKNICENKDGVLGFKCPVDEHRYGEFPSDCYHMDHRDGNHENNIPENIITICSLCHARKGKECGDFNGSKKTSRKLRKPVETSSDCSLEQMKVEIDAVSSLTISEVLLQ